VAFPGTRFISWICGMSRISYISMIFFISQIRGMSRIHSLTHFTQMWI
jgi:hypothetical protein